MAGGGTLSLLTGCLRSDPLQHTKMSSVGGGKTNWAQKSEQVRGENGLWPGEKDEKQHHNQEAKNGACHVVKGKEGQRVLPRVYDGFRGGKGKV